MFRKIKEKIIKEKKVGLFSTKFLLKKFSDGFTVIETLVAITILLLMIVGPMEIASKGLYSAFYARDEITAFYLAQEGIEFVRHARDTNDLNMTRNSSNPVTYWLDGLENCEKTATNDGCVLDAIQPFRDGSSGALNSASFGSGGFSKACPTTSPCVDKLRFNSSDGTYNYDSVNPDSKYTRLITIVPKDRNGNILNTINDINCTEVLVTSKITWKTSLLAAPKTFQLSEEIMNLQNN